jgi:hypothetical protein
MTTASFQDLQLRGEVPAVERQVCEGLVAEAYVHRGKVAANANVVFLKVDGHWHRLAIDFPVVFWRHWGEEPKPWRVPEEQWEYPHTDVARDNRLLGCEMTGLAIEEVTGGCRVTVRFADGRAFVVTNIADSSNYGVI